MNVHKELHSLDRYGELPQGYTHDNPYDDEILAELADENNERNIPDMTPETDFDDEGYEKYREETGLPKIRR